MKQKTSLNQTQEEQNAELINYLYTNKVQEWDVIEYLFEKLYPRFLYNLRLSNYKLNKLEEKLLILEKIGFNSKQSSSILKISKKTAFKTKKSLHRLLSGQKTEYQSTPFKIQKIITLF